MFAARLLIAAVTLCMISGPAHAATFVVDTTADGVDAVPGDGACADAAGACCLRCAVMEANALSGADEILLGPGRHDLSIPGADEDASATGDLDVTESLTLRGAGADVTEVSVAPGLADRILEVAQDDVVLVLEDVGLVDGEVVSDASALRFVPTSNAESAGRLELRRCRFEGHEVTVIHVGYTDFEIAESSFRGNVGVYVVEAFLADGRIADTEFRGNEGVPVVARNGAVDVVVERVTVVDNPYRFGPAIRGVAEVRNSYIARNPGGVSAWRLVEDTLVEDVDGTGIAIRPGGVVRRCLSRQNGVGITSDGSSWDLYGVTGPLVIDSTTSSSNGPFPLSPGLHVSHWGGLTVLVNSTVSGNVASTEGAEGAGVGIISGDLIVRSSTITDNHNPDGVGGGIHLEGDFRLESSIVHGNTARGLAADCHGPFAGGSTDGGSLVGDPTDCDVAWQPSDQLGVDPLLGPLQDNGGPTPTHALLDGSPAIDAGAADCLDADGESLLIDQRGAGRPVDGDADGEARCDAGAYEWSMPGFAVHDVVFEGASSTAAVAVAFSRACRRAPWRLCPDRTEGGVIDGHRMALEIDGARRLTLYEHSEPTGAMSLAPDGDEILFGRR